MPNTILVIKKDVQGVETFRYSGVMLERCPEYIRLEALFNRDDMLLDEVVLKRNDRFVETYYTQRWFNIFEIYDREDKSIKAWYCNIAYPAEVEDGIVSYRDLALDLLVYPGGRQVVLDEDEFEELQISTQIRQQAITALTELQVLFRKRH